MFGFQTNPQGVGTEHICAFAIQQERICTITEKPWAHSLVEPGCALWRLSHLLLAAENRVCKEPFANVCHLMSGSFPVILIGGLLQDWCLSICPESARAAHPRLQENIWQTDKLPNFCLLLIHQLEASEASSCKNRCFPLRLQHILRIQCFLRPVQQNKLLPTFLLRLALTIVVS